MIGKDIWEDIQIECVDLQITIDESARILIDHWGKDITKSDLLKLNAMSDTSHNGIERAIAKAALSYYGKKNYQPDFIHQYKIITKKPWWKFWRAA